MKLFKVLMVPAVVAAMGLTACTGGSSSSSSSSSSSGSAGPDCSTAPANSTPAAAAQGTLGTAMTQKICSGTTVYIKYGMITASTAMPKSYRVLVNFDKATGDVADADLGVLEAGQTTITEGSETSGNCSHSSDPNDEDCVVSIDNNGELMIELTPFSGAPDNASVTVTAM